MGTNNGNLRLLSEAGERIGDQGTDIRGYDVVDKRGQQVGTVDDLMIDRDETRVRFLRVGSGGFLGIGEDHYLVPVDAIQSVNDADETIHIDRDRQQMKDVPVYDPEVVEADESDYYGGIYGYWGYSPYWTAGYVYPAYPYR
jgi:sporulation protein YlmC with PRC-barrel domain